MYLYYIKFPPISYGEKSMNKISCLTVITFLVLSASTSVNAALSVEFDQGDVLIYCKRPPEVGQLPEEVFNKIFSKITARLQDYANEGKVVRAHYMSKLGQGLFIVVRGENKQDAMANAKRIRQENLITIYEITKESEIGPQPDYCQLLRVGPVAVLPTK
jgi:hypothetical protein